MHGGYIAAFHAENVCRGVRDKLTVVFDMQGGLESPSVSATEAHPKQKEIFPPRSGRGRGGVSRGRIGACGSRNQGQFHRGEWRPAITQQSGSCSSPLLTQNRRLMK